MFGNSKVTIPGRAEMIRPFYFLPDNSSTEEDHLQEKNDEMKELYKAFKDAILNLSANLEVEPKKFYIAFKKGKNIVDISIQIKA